MEINYQKMLETIMDALNYATLVDENCRIIYMSRNYYEGVYGLSRDDIIGRHICDIVPDSRIPAILKNGRASLGEYYYFQNTRENTFANRFPLYVDGELKGLFAEAVIYSFDDVVHMNELVHALKRENRILKKELLNIQKHRHGLESIVGKSEALQNTKKLISKFANSNLSILITGETGTGKELYANAIHYMSDRCNMPYVKINCAAIPGELLESELFGYEKGAFTGASEKGKIGKFEYANGGTILLDEIGEMPLFLQSKLLRVLQDKCVERVGGVKPIPLDMRVICSTNQNLEEAVRAGAFSKRSVLPYQYGGDQGAAAAPADGGYCAPVRTYHCAGQRRERCVCHRYPAAGAASAERIPVGRECKGTGACAAEGLCGRRCGGTDNSGF